MDETKRFIKEHAFAFSLISVLMIYSIWLHGYSKGIESERMKTLLDAARRANQEGRSG